MMNLVSRTLLSLSVFVSAMSLSALAEAAPVCSDAFSGKPVARIAFLSPLEDVKDIWNQVRGPRFKLQNYEQALDLYRSTDSSAWQKPANREAKLALLQVFSEKSGANPLSIESLVHRLQNNPNDLRRLANSVGKLDPQKGFSNLQIESIFLKVYGAQFATPLTSEKMKAMGVNAVEKELLRQWVDRELATRSLADAAGALGLLRSPNAKETFIEWYRDRSQVTDFLAKGIVNLMSLYTRGLISPRQFSALGRQSIAEEVRAALERDGFDATYPILKKHYGKLATFDRRYFLTKRYLRTAAMAALLIYFYPGLVQTVMGPTYDASAKSYVQLTEDVGVYTAQVATRFYQIKVLGEGGTTTVVTVKPVLDPNDPLQLNDGMGPSTDPDPVPVRAAGSRDVKAAQASATQKAITETEGFNRQMNDAIKIVRGDNGSGATATTPTQSQTQAEKEFEAYSNSLDNVDFSEFEPQ